MASRVRIEIVKFFVAYNRHTRSLLKLRSILRSEMKAINVHRGSWKTVLSRQGPLLLPAAHDALSARLIERTGSKAYQIGGLALAGSAHAVQDVGLDAFGEKAPLLRQMIN